MSSELKSASIVEFGIYCTKPIQYKGSRDYIYKGEWGQEPYDNGWKRETGVFRSTASNPVKFGSNWESEATHARWGECSSDLKETEWVPIDDNLRKQLKNVSADFFRVAGNTAEKWSKRTSYSCWKDLRTVPQGLEPIPINDCVKADYGKFNASP